MEPDTCVVGSHTYAEQAWHLVQMRNVTKIVDKMLRNAFNLGYIQLALPRSCVIHTVRHPLDVALSCFSQPFEGRGLPWAAQLDGELPCQVDCVTGFGHAQTRCAMPCSPHLRAEIRWPP